MKPKLSDYLYCLTCDTIFDYWKYDCLNDAGHTLCKTRRLTQKEYELALKSCKEVGCY